jgi:hypothetical protein
MRMLPRAFVLLSNAFHIRRSHEEAVEIFINMQQPLPISGTQATADDVKEIVDQAPLQRKVSMPQGLNIDFKERRVDDIQIQPALLNLRGISRSRSGRSSPRNASDSGVTASKNLEFRRGL